MGWWKDLWKREAEDWTYVELEEQQADNPLPVQAVEANAAYIHIVLRSMRIVHVRKGLSKFYGAVHSWISVPHMGDGSAEFQVLTTPSELKDADASNLDRVISIDQRLLGPVPFRGGDIELELGLFSIKSADLAGPYLDVLESMSNAAGVSFVSAAMPFVGPIRAGIDLLAGSDKESILEVGHARDIADLRTGYFGIIRAPRGSIDKSKLRLAQDRRLELDGSAIEEYPYIVWSVEATSKRPDWFSIPELTKSYGDLRTAVQAGKAETVKESFGAFSRAAQTSPDLLFDDAVAIVAEVNRQVATVMAPTQTGLTATDERALPDLGEVSVDFGGRGGG